MENLLQSIVLGHKETQKKMDEQTDVLNKILDVQKNELKAEQRREKREAQASKRRKSDESGDGLLGKMLGKEKKKGKGILATILGGIGSLLTGLGGLGLVKALGLGAIGASIAAYFTNDKFRKFLNEKVFAPMGGFIKEGLLGPDGIFGKKNVDKTWNWIKDNPLKTLQVAAVAAVAIFGPKSVLMLGFKSLGVAVQGISALLGVGGGAGGLMAKIAALAKALGVAGAAKLGGAVAAPIALAYGGSKATEAIVKNRYGGGAAGDQGYQLYLEEMELNAKGKNSRGRRTKPFTEEEKARKKEIAEQRAELVRIKEERDKAKSEAIEFIGSGRSKKKVTDKDKMAAANAAYEAAFAAIQEKYGFQSGGFVGTVPGQGGDGDRFRTSVAPGSVVLNQTAAGMFQEGGQVPVMLEQGEKVFSPNDPAAGAALMMNSMIGRFQTGGVVQDSHPDTGSGWSVGKDYKGRPSIFTKEAADSFVAMTKASNGLVRATDIASSTRSPQKNASVGGVPNSNHLHGEAVDIHGASKVWMKQNGMAHGWKNLVYSGHDGHFDYRGGGARLVPGDGDEKTARNLMGSVAESQLGKLISGMAGAINDVFGDMLGNMFGGLLGGAGNLLSGTGGGSGVGTGPVDMGADVNEQLMNTAKLAMSAGFNKSEAKTMAAIAGGESTFNNKAHNNNALTGDNSYGLWQINMLGKMGAARRAEFGISSNEDLFNPMTNAKAAKKIYDSQGFGAWGAYKDGNAAKYTNAAQSLQLQNGGVANVRGASSSQSAAMVSKSQEQFAQKIAEAVGGPIVIPVPSGGGGGGGTVVQPGNDTKMPMLPSADNSIMAMEYKYRITMGASI